MKQLVRKALVAVAAFGMMTMLSGESAQATTQTSNLTVSAFVNGSCTISTTALNFGNYDTVLQAASPLDNSSGGVALTCTNTMPYTLRLGQGTNADAGSTADAPVRRMLGPVAGQYLGYQLYRDVAGGSVWGDTVATGKAGTGTGAVQNHTVFGRIPAAQAPVGGAYNDTVVATVEF